jgi:hypothetical protein
MKKNGVDGNQSEIPMLYAVETIAKATSMSREAPLADFSVRALPISL